MPMIDVYATSDTFKDPKANTNSELVDAARAQIAELQRAKGSGG